MPLVSKSTAFRFLPQCLAERIVDAKRRSRRRSNALSSAADDSGGGGGVRSTESVEGQRSGRSVDVVISKDETQRKRNCGEWSVVSLFAYKV